MSAAPKIGESKWSTIINEVCAIVSKNAGIQLNEKNHGMVENRLRSRVLKLGIKDPNDYLQYLHDNMTAETQALVSLMTTHHTYFFREFGHFEHLLAELPRLIKSIKARGDNTLRLWSAACSRGQEVYSLATFLDVHLKSFDPSIQYEILGTDVDTESVKIAKNGVFQYKDVKEIPSIYLAENWTRGSGDIAEFAKIKESIKKKCKFETMNILEPAPWVKAMKFDIVFCRNVFIYFSSAQIKSVSEFIMSTLQPGGLYFIGISETLSSLGLNLETTGPSVYRVKSLSTSLETKTQSHSKANSKIPAANHQVSPLAASPLKIPNPIKVLCVDDSPSVLTLLKKILSKDTGFEVVGTAVNGLEAEVAVKKLNPDIITLDIHMPEMDGVTYLQKNMNSKHPPVVVLSTVNRENADLALKTLQLGASDYVEKPQLNNLAEKGEELRSKLKTSIMLKSLPKTVSQLDKSFQRKYTIAQPEKKFRIVTGSIGQIKDFVFLAGSQHASDPTLILLIEGAGEAIDKLHSDLMTSSKQKISKDIEGLKNSTKGQIFLFSESAYTQLLPLIKQRQVSVLTLGLPSKKTSELVLQISGAQLLVQDLGPQVSSAQHLLLEVSTDKIPVTSFMSVSEEFYAGTK